MCTTVFLSDKAAEGLAMYSRWQASGQELRIRTCMRPAGIWFDDTELEMKNLAREATVVLANAELIRSLRILGLRATAPRDLLAHSYIQHSPDDLG